MLQEKELSLSGRNWGDAVIDGSTLVFNVAGKPAFRIPLTDVGQVTCCPCECITSFRGDNGLALSRPQILLVVLNKVPWLRN